MKQQLGGTVEGTFGNFLLPLSLCSFIHQSHFCNSSGSQSHPLLMDFLGMSWRHLKDIVFLTLHVGRKMSVAENCLKLLAFTYILYTWNVLKTFTLTFKVFDIFSFQYPEFSSPQCEMRLQSLCFPVRLFIYALGSLVSYNHCYVTLGRKSQDW